MKYQITYQCGQSPSGTKQTIEADLVYEERGFLYFTNKDKTVEALISSGSVMSVLKVKD